MINFPFGTNGKLIILGVPILKHITVVQILIRLFCTKKLSDLDLHCLLRDLGLNIYGHYIETLWHVSNFFFQITKKNWHGKVITFS